MIKGTGEWVVWTVDLLRLKAWVNLFERTLLSRMRGAESVFEGERLVVKVKEGAGWYKIKVYPTSQDEWMVFEREVSAGVLQSEFMVSLKKTIARLPFVGGRWSKEIPVSGGDSELNKLGYSYTFSWKAGVEN